MKNSFIFIVLIVIFSSVNLSYSQSQESFKELVKLLSIKYSNDSSLKEKINTTQIKCNYLIADESKKIEVLYSLIPAENYKDNLLNKIYKNIALQSLVKFSQASDGLLSGEKLITEFDNLNVKKEFNADWGGTSSFKFTSDRFCKYKFCIILFLYKKDKGLAITYFLFDKESVGLQEVENNFHNLTFIRQN
ncbi:hypothetical protein [Aquimarina macrocephali]|uniref:hypothetical protein n=1 Tax=Aquimarina macrocephali TaxID=666563 RepID=UPI000463AABB|nr:hypothetical protein [Aquimarina macrocephali]